MLFFSLFQTIRNSKQDRSAVGKRNTHRTVEGQCTLAQAREQPTKRRQHSDWTQNVKPADTGKQTHGNMLDSECTHNRKRCARGSLFENRGDGVGWSPCTGLTRKSEYSSQQTKVDTWPETHSKKTYKRQNMGL